MSVKLLKIACEKYGQRQAGVKIGKSAATVNLVLKGTYPKPQKILQRVSEVFAALDSNELVCPVIGEIHINVCMKYKVMAEQGKVHRDRLYMQVRDECLKCRGVNNE